MEFNYAVTGDSSIAGVEVQPSGTAGTIPGSPFPAGITTLHIAKHGTMVFASGAGTPTQIVSYSQDPNGGGLSMLSAVAAPATFFGFHSGLAVDPSGRFIYASGGALESTDPDMAGFSIAPNGQLTPVPGSPFSNNNHPDHIVFSPNGKYIYGTTDVGPRSTAGAIAFAQIDTRTGAIISTNLFRADAVQGISVTHDGRFLIGAALGAEGPANQICSFAVDQATGFPSTTTVACAPIAAGGTSTSIFPGHIAISPNGRFVVGFMEGTTRLSIFSFSNGKFTAAPGSPFAVPSAVGASFSEDGRYLFVSNGASDSTTIFQVNQSTGALTQAPGSPVKLTVTPKENVSN